MSALEVEVRPLLLALAEGARSPEVLNSAERLLLARWAMKTAAALNHASNYYTVVTYEQARAVRDGAPLRGTVVFARRMPRQYEALSWHQSLVGPATMPHGMDVAEPMEAMRASWRIVLVVGQLLLMVVQEPRADWVLLPHPRIHVPVWPTGGSWPAQDDREPTPREELPAETLYFMLDLFVAHRSLEDGYGRLELPH